MPDLSVDDLLAAKPDGALSQPEWGRYVWRLEKALRAQTAETERLKDAEQDWVDRSCYYRNTAIQAGAAPEVFENEYDQALARDSVGCCADNAKLERELADAHDRLDENEGTIAALRQQLAEARGLMMTARSLADSAVEGDQSHELLGQIYGDLCDLLSGDELAEARAAAPDIKAEPGSWDDRIEAVLRELDGEEDEEPWPELPGERIDWWRNRARLAAAYILRHLEARAAAADQTPPAVTRDQIRDAIWSTLRPWMYPEGAAGDEEAAEWFEDAVPDIADAVWALLTGEGNT